MTINSPFANGQRPVTERRDFEVRRGQHKPGVNRRQPVSPDLERSIRIAVATARLADTLALLKLQRADLKALTEAALDVE